MEVAHVWHVICTRTRRRGNAQRVVTARGRANFAAGALRSALGTTRSTAAGVTPRNGWLWHSATTATRATARRTGGARRCRRASRRTARSTAGAAARRRWRTRWSRHATTRHPGARYAATRRNSGFTGPGYKCGKRHKQKRFDPAGNRSGCLTLFHRPDPLIARTAQGLEHQIHD